MATFLVASLYLIISLRRLCLAIGCSIVLTGYSFALDFDHSHKNWTQLLSDVVVLSEDKKQSRLDYQKVYAQTQQLDAYLAVLSDISKTHYDDRDHNQRLSFLINAYNAFTLKLINDNWHKFEKGEAESIRDLGTSSTIPWKINFFSLFGQTHSLDDIEHEMIRTWFERPRIHVALVCAAVSCPPLRNEAFVAETLDSQLDDQMSVFLADVSRNEILINNDKVIIELSPIFKWYAEDFEKGHNGFNSIGDMLISYKEALVQGDTDKKAKIDALENAKYTIHFKDYDWKLNHVSTF